MLKEVIVVEGRADVAAIRRAVEADCLITGGFTLSKNTLNDIKAAYKKRGIIILTDPDDAGERIRRFLTTRFPKAKHAYIPREDATKDGDVGIEDAAPAAILAALSKIHTATIEPSGLFSTADMNANGLAGTPDAAERRARLGKILGLGFANAKVFLRRLNHYSITREEFLAGLEQING